MGGLDFSKAAVRTRPATLEDPAFTRRVISYIYQVGEGGVSGHSRPFLGKSAYISRQGNPFGRTGSGRHTLSKLVKWPNRLHVQICAAMTLPARLLPRQLSSRQSAHFNTPGTDNRRPAGSARSSTPAIFIATGEHIPAQAYAFLFGCVFPAPLPAYTLYSTPKTVHKELWLC